MGFEYIRQLTVELDKDSLEKVYSILCDNGFETYYSTGEEKQKEFHISESFMDFVKADSIIYVPAADRATIVRLLSENGFENIICQEQVADVTESELDKAKRLYYKRRKMIMIEWIAVIVIAFIFFLVRGNLFLK